MEDSSEESFSGILSTDFIITHLQKNIFDKLDAFWEPLRRNEVKLEVFGHNNNTQVFGEQDTEGL